MKEDCSTIPSYSGEHIACEIRNEQIDHLASQNFCGGMLIGLLLGAVFALFFVWLDNKEKELKNRHPY